MLVAAGGGTMLLLFLNYSYHLSILILLQSGYQLARGQSASGCHPVYHHLPECVNHPDGYGCKCGPGFIWNTHMCVASGLDSRLAFDTNTTLRYAGVVNKPLPELTSFTISFWLRLHSSKHPGTVLSYTGHDGTPNVLRILSGPFVVLQVLDETIRTDLRVNQSQWTHLAWTWTSQGGFWRLYVDGARLTLKGRAARADRPISGGGELVLGQSSRSENEDHNFDLRHAFIGDIAFANIWSRVMSRAEVRTLKEDCELMKCGDVVEWADFRSGTRGDMKIRWPSKIYKRPCFDEERSGLTCDRHCSVTYGPRCNKEIKQNIIWERTPADHNATVICPGAESKRKTNATTYAYRECIKISHSKGMWLEPIMTECTSPELLDFTRFITNQVKVKRLNESEILLLAERFYNMLSDEIYDNAIDISACMDILTVILNAQVEVLYKVLSKNVSKSYGMSRRQDQLVYPTLNDTYSVMGMFFKIINRLLTDDNDPGWLGSQPKGHEGDRLLKVTKKLDNLIADSLALHVSRGDITPSEHAEMSFTQKSIALQVKIYKTAELGRLYFPNSETRQEFKHLKGTLSASRQAILSRLNVSVIPEYLTISLGAFDASKTLPNRNLTGKYTKEDNINSNLFYMNIHEADYDCDLEENRSEYMVKIKFVYLDNFNISNPECVRLINSDKSNEWRWSRDGCRLDHNTSVYSVCYCRAPGVFAVITDMYNLDWDRGEKPMILMDVPSYIGCSLSALLCLLSGILLIYYRTSSKTAALHKNFALSITCSQLSFMFGVDKTENELACHVFAITFHYFFLSTFSWLMNEAFNLYIVITYAAHSHGEHAEAGSQWRYYILGWILPGILVGAFVGTYQYDYYAQDMCWIAWKHVWLFLGPAIGIISVTVLVLIFIAKEHHESAYSKNEETNNMIIIYAKALWTQTILITLCWSFAFLSIRMRGIIIKCLYALFNGLQGAFFLVFYFLLHDEVQRVIKARVKKKSLVKQGYGESIEEDSLAFAHELEELTTPGISGSGCRQKVNSRSTPPRVTHYSSDESDQSGDDILVTSV